jgi:phosphopantetheinyl transferase
VSFSRTGSHAVTAISDLADIGVDIEDSRPGRRWLQLATTVGRHGWPAGCEDAAERARWVCRQFVVKEALLKGVGVGLRFPLGAIDVHYSEQPVELYQQRAQRQPCRPRTWHVISEMRRFYSLALAVKYPQTCGALTITEFHASGGVSSETLEIVSRTLFVGGAAE